MRGVRKNIRRLLSIDGGGVRGVIPAAILVHVENAIRDEIRLRNKGDPQFESDTFPVRLTDYFDGFAGTSTGAIIALCYAADGAKAYEGIVKNPKYAKGMKIYLELTGKTGPPGPTEYAEQCLCVYLMVAHVIFPQSMISIPAIFSPKYSPKGLEGVLMDAFEHLKLSDLKKSNVIIPTYSIAENAAMSFYADRVVKGWNDGAHNYGIARVQYDYHVFDKKEDVKKVEDEGSLLTVKKGGCVKHNDDLFFDTGTDFFLRDVIRSSTAAPTYFPAATIYSPPIHPQTNPPSGEKFVMVDGGVVSNNPAQQGLMSLAMCRKDKRMPMSVLSLGTGNLKRDFVELENGGLLAWGASISDVTMNGASELDQAMLDEYYDTVFEENPDLKNLPLYVRIQKTINAFPPRSITEEMWDNFNLTREEKAERDFKRAMGTLDNSNKDHLKMYMDFANQERHIRLVKAYVKHVVFDTPLDLANNH